MEHLIWLILALPLIGVVINGFWGGRLPKVLVAWIGCAVVGLAFLVAVLVMVPEVNQARHGLGYRDLTLYQWLTSRQLVHGFALNVPFAVRLDPL